MVDSFDAETGRPEPAYVCLVTTPPALAETIARTLVEERLAACVNIMASVRSIYRWQGKIEDDAESLLVIKTRRACFEALEARVRALHEYTTPEVIALPIAAGSKPYLEWLAAETMGAQPTE